MSVSVSMPQLGESVTEGTVTRWLKREGEHVQADEPLLEVSTDKVDTEIPSPVSGVLRGITVAEDETVAVGAELATIDEDGAAGQQPAAAAAPAQAPAAAAPPSPVQPAPQFQAEPPAAPPQPAPPQAPPAAAQYAPPAQPVPPAQPAQAAEPPAPSVYAPSAYTEPAASYQPAAPEATTAEPPAPAAAPEPAAEPAAPPYQPAAPYQPAGYDERGNGQAAQPAQFTADVSDGPYVTPLVRKLAAEHGIDLGTIAGTGVGGRIRKQDILDAAARRRGPAGQAQAAAPPPVTAQPAPIAQPAAPAQPTAAAYQAAAPAPAAAPSAGPAAPVAPAAPMQTPYPPATAPAEAEQARPRPAIVPSSLRGTTERMSRARQVIAQRMVESLQTSAQLTTVVEADVTAIARLRGRAKAAFEAREGVKLSFLPFFALAAVEALKVHPKLNAVIDTASNQVTYHDAEHLGIAVDTERGLMVPVIKNAGDLNIGGLARKIADLAARTRAGHVSPDDLSGGTFTLTNTGSRGALFDTPIINQPQVGILGTGTVVKRAVVVEDPTLGEVITVRSMVYLALTYDHRLVDGADAARFLLTVKERLEEGAFETELGL
jgi:2-oxoglutarate dehydrogenase E2 component (dihydrolipoamide succinyltransferase)